MDTFHQVEKTFARLEHILNDFELSKEDKEALERAVEALAFAWVHENQKKFMQFLVQFRGQLNEDEREYWRSQGLLK